MHKIGEGNYNKVFRLQMDDGAVAIARIPHPNAGPPRYTTASEVATMEFARSIIKVPVPRVLSCCATAKNPVGSEYIIMEEAKGTQLTQRWGDLTLSENKSIIEDIVGMEQKLLSISLNLLGSIYFADDRFPGCEAAGVVGEVPTATRDELTRRLVIGPTAQREFWGKERSQMSLDRGPWKTTGEYVEAVAHREIAWIDLHDGNLYVHDGKVSSVIDWQCAWVRPLILQARTPRLIDYSGETMLRLPNNYKELSKDEKEQVSDQVSRSLQLYLYQERTAQRNPLLNKAVRQPHGKMMSRLLSFAEDSWDDDILPLRECLIQLERNWQDLDSGGTCPYHFTADEIRQHYTDGDGFNETRDFWDMLEGKVDSSGWTAHDNFDNAVEYFSRLRKAGLDSLVGEERNIFETQTRWVLEHTARTT
ncbi:hypothetical protein AJ80_00507 [Polytolypa hystricis UAMH7299]|uniref:Aminoglycoside phosphotransferase domain-containing protein n=1 Tax=Polytolypa hystricis (strain UAMH7299) TaxID=1447883 RepID=A0A2B7Z2T9_POLH7|nr:hypothetical protein AJ80_00507 [Polytolypa hystricis UAMH7299]